MTFSEKNWYEEGEKNERKKFSAKYLFIWFVKFNSEKWQSLKYWDYSMINLDSNWNEKA